MNAHVGSQLHKCPITGCDRMMPQHLLMCPDHWHLVPENVRRHVNQAWRSGGARTYMWARAAAVKAVEEALRLQNENADEPKPAGVERKRSDDESAPFLL